MGAGVGWGDRGPGHGRGSEPSLRPRGSPRKKAGESEPGRNKIRGGRNFFPPPDYPAPHPHPHPISPQIILHRLPYPAECSAHPAPEGKEFHARVVARP